MNISLSRSDPRRAAILAAVLAAAAAAADLAGEGTVSGVLSAATALTAALSAALLCRAVGRVAEAAEVLDAAARGEMERRIVDLPIAGPVGALQRAVNRSLDIADAFVREAGGAMGAAAEGRYHRVVLLRGLPGAYQAAARRINAAGKAMDEKAARFLRMADDFEREVGSVVGNVSSAAATLHGSATQLSATATEANTRTQAAADATGEVTKNTQTVAAATEELSASVQEISRQVTEAARVAR